MRFVIFNERGTALVEGNMQGMIFTAGAEALIKVEGSSDVKVFEEGITHRMRVSDGEHACEIMVEGVEIRKDTSTVNFPRGLYTALEGSLVLE